MIPIVVHGQPSTVPTAGAWWNVESGTPSPPPPPTIAMPSSWECEVGSGAWTATFGADGWLAGV